MLLSNIKEEIDMNNNMNESQNQYAEGKKPDQKKKKSTDSDYTEIRL